MDRSAGEVSKGCPDGQGLPLSSARRRAARPGIARWTLAFGHHEDRTPTHGYAATREGRYGRVRQELAAGVEGSLAVGKRVTP